MPADKFKLLGLLRRELRFLNSRGYRTTSWRPQFIFEDSPTCQKNGDRLHATTCSDCVLMKFVPANCRQNTVPCRQISLSAEGETIDYLYCWGSQDEMEEALRSWLMAEIRKLESDERRDEAPLATSDAKSPHPPAAA
jgi:hypothetical protein